MCDEKKFRMCVAELVIAHNVLSYFGAGILTSFPFSVLQ